MRQVETFSLRESDRRIDPEGGDKTARHFLDFVVDGQSLYQMLTEYDLITGLSADDKVPLRVAEATIDRLLGSVAGDAPRGRVSVYVCPECGDLGCGALTVELRRTPDRVMWLAWGYQNNYEDTLHAVDLGLDELSFDRDQYEAVLRAGRLRLGRNTHEYQSE